MGILIKMLTQLLLSQEDKPQSHRTVREISREAGDPSVISFADYSQRYASQVLQEKARSTADRSAQHAHVMDKKILGCGAYKLINHRGDAQTVEATRSVKRSANRP